MNRREMAGLGLAVLLVGLVAATEPEIRGLKCTPGSSACGDSPVLGYGLEPDASSPQSTYAASRIVSPSSRGTRPEVLGARSVPAKPTVTVAASPTSVGPVSLGSFTITRYTDNDGEGMDGRGITRSGERTRPGVAAADWRVLPMGTRVIVEGVGEFTVLDTGGRIVGRRLDLWTQDRREALRFGVRELGVILVIGEGE